MQADEPIIISENDDNDTDDIQWIPGPRRRKPRRPAQPQVIELDNSEEESFNPPIPPTPAPQQVRPSPSISNTATIVISDDDDDIVETTGPGFKRGRRKRLPITPSNHSLNAVAGPSRFPTAGTMTAFGSDARGLMPDTSFSVAGLRRRRSKGDIRPVQIQMPEPAKKRRRVETPAREKTLEVIDLLDDSDTSDVVMHSPGPSLQIRGDTFDPEPEPQVMAETPLDCLTPEPELKVESFNSETRLSIDIPEVTPEPDPDERSFDFDDWELYHTAVMWPKEPTPPIENIPDPTPEFEDIDFVAWKMQRVLLVTDPCPTDRYMVYPPAANSRRAVNQFPLNARTKVRHIPPASIDAHHQPLERIKTFRAASGGICAIAQSGGTTVIGSAAVGGTNQIWGADLRACNVPGSLIVWNQDRPSEVRIPSQTNRDDNPAAHYQDQEVTLPPLDDSEEAEPVTVAVRVHYSVTDVKFSPVEPGVFLSSALDRSVMRWEFEEDRVDPQMAWSYNYPAEPNCIDYKPGSSIFAVGCSDGFVYLHYLPDAPPRKLQATKKRLVNLEVTAQVWGPINTRSENLLFIGGAPQDSTLLKGAVGVWSMRPEQPECITNSGYCVAGETAWMPCDVLAVDPLGERLAVVSTVDSGSDIKDAPSGHIVELWDVRGPAKPIHHQRLSPFSYGSGGEVLSATFSPDGIYFACARDDNVVQVWDSRFLGDKPLRELKHGDAIENGSRGRRYGVTAMDWAGRDDGYTSAPVLVTGGDDGKIIEWDLRKPDEERRILAELETNIGSFHLGDVYKGEMPLIAGDCDANLYIYDRNGLDFTRRRHSGR